MRIRLIILLILVCGSFAICPATTTAQDAPKVEDIVRAGRTTAQKFNNVASSWTVKFHQPNGSVLEVRVVHDGERQSWTLYGTANGRMEPILQIIQTGGIWHVMEKGHVAKYRPYEAELHFPASYLFLTFSELRCVMDASVFASAKFESRNGSVCSYRVPITADQRRILEQVVSGFDSLAAKDPKILQRQEVADVIRQSREQLDKGAPLQVDEKSGMILEMKLRDMLIAVRDFRWLMPSDAFALPHDAKWDDQSSPLSRADLDDCVMVSHDPIFIVGGKPSIDGYLLNLKNGRLRRLPYRGVGTMPGCFLKGRAEVMVSGVDGSQPMALTRLNLMTGENSPASFEGINVFIGAVGELSPDEQKFAGLQAFGGGTIPELQVRVFDLQARESKLLGKPSDLGAPISWLPDGQGLILKRTEPVKDPGIVEPRILCKVGLDGRLSDLRPGDWPVVLRKSRKILYVDTGTRDWHTCDLDGSNPKLYADGMQGYAMPSVSPDEKRILFVRYEKGKAPQLKLFEIGMSEGRPAAQADGFTSIPVWR